MRETQERRRLREIIAALQAKTTGAGCTEAEALAAAEKVSDLLSKHGVEDVEALDFEEWRVEIGRRSVVDDLWDRLAIYCHCKLWYSRSWGSRGWTIVYFGRWNDVAVAEYLHTLLERSIRAAIRSFQKTPEYKRRRSARTKREATKAFTEGMAQSLSAKLWAIQWRRTPFVDGTDHHALVLQPLAAVDAELKRRGMVFDESLKPVKGAGKGFDNAKGSGHAAARDIDLNAAMTDRPPEVAGYLS